MVHHAETGTAGPRLTDTIAAVATAAGRGAIGILRISGPDAARVAERLAGPLPQPRVASLRTFHDLSSAALDRGLVLHFPAPHSFTGEAVVELQGHGGPVVLQALLQAACDAGARPARPGEFSERAFVNGRLDLVQAEAIADLIDASSREAAIAAHRSLEGALSRMVNALAEEMQALRAFVEGALDFSDEDVDWLSDEGLGRRLLQLTAQLDGVLAQAAQGRRLREGINVAIVGQPNVGKSTLLNRLAGTEAAIVTEIPGTTRDLLREHVVLEGLPMTLIDTAGLRETEDPVEREGVRRAWSVLEGADVVLFVLDDRAGLTPADAALLARVPPAPATLLIRNKCDLSGRAPQRQDGMPASVRLCAQTGQGLGLLAEELKRMAGLGAGAEGAFSARARHVEALQRARMRVAQAQAHLRSRAPAELAAEELRLAQHALAEITGAFTTEDLLGAIFARFCIGK